MKIAAVIVTYNRLEKLKKAIEATCSQALDEIVVVNNKSTDDTQNWLEQKLKDHKQQKQSKVKLTILNLEENTGGAGGFYHGCKYVAENTDNDWVVLFDDDAYPQERLFENFRQISVDNDVKAISTKVCMPNGEIADFNRPGINPFASVSNLISYLFNGNAYPDADALEQANGLLVDFSSFVGFFVRTDFMKDELGYPLKKLFIYCDDWIYSNKVTKLGYKNLYFSDLVFIHDSNTFIDSYDAQIWKKYYAYRNSLLFYRETSGIFFPIVLLAKFAKWLLDTKLYKKKVEYLKTVFRALWDGLSFNTRYFKNRYLNE